MRTRFSALIAFLFILASAAAAFGQEALGAGRMELSATPGGGILYTKAAKANDIDFSNYALGGGFTYNVNRLFGVEAELGAGLGVRHTFTNATVVPMLDEGGNPVLDESGNVVTRTNLVTTRTLSPRTLAYEGNLVYHPRGNDHALVPYVTAGMGGLTMFTREALKNVGLRNDETFFTGNAGAGLKWFVTRDWGVRADYRFLAVKSRADAPEFFGLNETRYGHRVYGSVVYTFGM